VEVLFGKIQFFKDGITVRRPARGVFLIDSFGSGGAQRQFVELVTSIDRRRVTPFVVTYYDIPFFRKQLLDAGVEHVCLAKWDKLGITFLVKWVMFLKKNRPDFIHSFLNIPNFYARLAKFLGFVPMVITSERNISLTDSRELVILEKMFWRLSDRIIANAWGVREVLTREIEIPDEYITVIHNGVATDRFRQPCFNRVAEIRAKSGASHENCVLVGMIGRVLKQKNQLGLLHAMAKIKSKDGSLPFRVGFWGSEPDSEYAALVRNTATALILDPHVTYFEPEEDVASVYAACDIVVLPSLWEGFPNVVLEAMSAGRVVVASDIVDNAHIIDNGRNGFIVRPGDVEDLSRVIVNVLGLSKDERRKIELRAEERVLTSFSLQKMVQSTMDVYKELGLC